MARLGFLERPSPGCPAGWTAVVEGSLRDQWEEYDNRLPETFTTDPADCTRARTEPGGASPGDAARSRFTRG